MIIRLIINCSAQFLPLLMINHWVVLYMEINLAEMYERVYNLRIRKMIYGK